MEANTFFDALRHGEYDSMPKALRELFILAVNNQEQETLTVRCYTRPTLIEDAVYKYGLQGIEIKLETNAKKAASIFTHSFRMNIAVQAFLSNLNIFYNVSAEQLQERYGKSTMTLEDALAKRNGRRSKSQDDEENKNPREKEILLFKRIFGEVWKPKL